MSKSTKIFFSKEHTGSSGKREIDVHRQKSDSPRHEKINHCNVNPGYGQTPAKVNINKK